MKPKLFPGVYFSFTTGVLYSVLAALVIFRPVTLASTARVNLMSK